MDAGPPSALDSLVAHWSFDEPDMGEDLVGDVDLVSAGGRPHSPRVQGRDGCALATGELQDAMVFHGLDGSLALLSEGSITAWVWRDPNDGDVSWDTFFSAARPWGCNMTFTLAIPYDGVEVETVIDPGVPPYQCSSASDMRTRTPDVPLDQWIHVAYVTDDAGHRVFVDGLEAPLTRPDMNAGGAGLRRFFADVAFNGFIDLGVGRTVNYLGTHTPFEGLIDDVRVYSAPLAQSDVQQLIAETAAGACTAGPPLEAGTDGAGSLDDTFVASLNEGATLTEIVALALGDDGVIYAAARTNSYGSALLAVDPAVGDPVAGFAVNGQVVIGGTMGTPQEVTDVAFVPAVDPAAARILFSVMEKGGANDGYVAVFDPFGVDSTLGGLASPPVAPVYCTMCPITPLRMDVLRDAGGAGVHHIGIVGDDRTRSEDEMVLARFTSTGQEVGTARVTTSFGTDPRQLLLTAADEARIVGGYDSATSSAIEWHVIGVDGLPTQGVLDIYASSLVSGPAKAAGLFQTSTDLIRAGWRDHDETAEERLWLEGDDEDVASYTPGNTEVASVAGVAGHDDIVYVAGDLMSGGVFVFAASATNRPIPFGDNPIAFGFAPVPGVAHARAVAANDDGIYVAGCADAGCTTPALVRLRRAP